MANTSDNDSTEAAERSRRGGRPPKPAGLRKQSQVTVRMTQEQRNLLEERAAQAGLRLGPYIVESAIEGAVVERQTLADKQAWLEFQRIKKNLNQVAREVSVLKNVVETSEETTPEHLSELERLLERVIRQHVFIKEEMSALKLEFGTT